MSAHCPDDGTVLDRVIYRSLHHLALSVMPDALRMHHGKVGDPCVKADTRQVRPISGREG